MAREIVSAGGTASGTVVSSGGGEFVLAGGTAAGIVAQRRRHRGAESPARMTTSGDRVRRQQRNAGNGGTVMPAVTISGFAPTDTIDLTNEAYTVRRTGHSAGRQRPSTITGIGAANGDLQLAPAQIFVGAKFSLAS